MVMACQGRGRIHGDRNSLEGTFTSCHPPGKDLSAKFPAVSLAQLRKKVSMLAPCYFHVES